MKKLIYEDDKKTYYEYDGSLFYLDKENGNDYRIIEEDMGNIYLYSLSGLVVEKEDAAYFAARQIMDESIYKDMSLHDVRKICSINYNKEAHRAISNTLDNILKLKCVNQLNTREYVVVGDTESFSIDIFNFNINGINASVEYIDSLFDKSIENLAIEISRAKIIWEISGGSV